MSKLKPFHTIIETLLKTLKVSGLACRIYDLGISDFFVHQIRGIGIWEVCRWSHFLTLYGRSSYSVYFYHGYFLLKRFYVLQTSIQTIHIMAILKLCNISFALGPYVCVKSTNIMKQHGCCFAYSYMNSVRGAYTSSESQGGHCQHKHVK